MKDILRIGLLICAWSTVLGAWLHVCLYPWMHLRPMTEHFLLTGILFFAAANSLRNSRP